MTTGSATAGVGETRPSIAVVAHRAWASTRHFRPVLTVLILLVIGFSLSQSAFLTTANLQNLLTSSAITWVAAMGMTFVLISGGFDLSVGAVAAFCGVVLAKLLGAGLPGGIALVLTLGAGGLLGGGINGILIGRLRLSVFVVTLATLTALSGVVNLWTKTTSIYVTAPIVSAIAINKLLGIPTLIWIMAGTLILALYVQSKTLYGRDVYAIGGSELAARLSGIRTSRVLIMVYALMGLCAALAGVIAVGIVGAASPQVDNTLALTSIAAVLIGGTSLTGGIGGVGGTSLGVLFIGVLENGLSLSGVPSAWQQVLTGVILVVAVVAPKAEAWAKRPSRGTAAKTGGVAGAVPAPQPAIAESLEASRPTTKTAQ